MIGVSCLNVINMMTRWCVVKITLLVFESGHTNQDQ